MRGARSVGFARVEGEELGAQFGEVDFLRVGGAFGVCVGKEKGRGQFRGEEEEGAGSGGYLRGGPWCGLGFGWILR